MSAVIAILRFQDGWEWQGQFEGVGSVDGCSTTLIGALEAIIKWAEPIEKEVEAYTMKGEGNDCE